MPISSINDANLAYRVATSSGTPSAGVQADAPASVTAGTAAVSDASTDTSASYTVTLGDGQTRTILPGHNTVTPLSECYAPQMLFQADQNKDAQLDIGEFSKQMKRVGVSAEMALTMFKSFDQSQDGQVSVKEFIAGIKSANATGDQLFQALVNTYTEDANGNFNEAKSGKFLSDGLDFANRYGPGRG